MTDVANFVVRWIDEIILVHVLESDDGLAARCHVEARFDAIRNRFHVAAHLLSRLRLLFVLGTWLGR